MNSNLVLLGRQKQLVIANPVLWHSGPKELIFLIFGKADDMRDQLSVFRSLTEKVSVNPDDIPPAHRYTYWDLRNCVEQSADRDSIELSPVDEVISTCNRIIAAAGHAK